MRKGLGKYTLIVVGGLLGLMVLGMAYTAIFSSPQEVKGVDLIKDWKFYRFAFYAAVLLAWTPICHYLTRDRGEVDFERELTPEEWADHQKKRKEDIQYLKGFWWKIALIFLFFEFVIIQQFGL